MHLIMRCAVFFVAAFASIVVYLHGAPPGTPSPCRDCLQTRYWQIDSDDFERGGDATFPEADFLKDRADVGIAFSGGGTRSAAATLGQLQGLQRLGWLSQVRYVSAVSGGAWAAIPFVYSKLSIGDFLGRYQSPAGLKLPEVQTVANGGLGLAIANSSLVSGTIREGLANYLNIRERQQEAPNPLLNDIVWLTNRLRREGSRRDKTYARMIGSIFVSDSLVEKDASTNLFSWNTEIVTEMMAKNPGKLPMFVMPHMDRPFLIAGGTMVSPRRDYAYPLLMPVEYTPMYVGVRQTFGGFGGGYVWPWAYDPMGVGRAIPDQNPQGLSTDSGFIDVKIDPARRFTLADVAAGTGAAPEIPASQGLGLGEPLKSRVAILSTFFPAFRYYAIHDPNRVVLTDAMPHGDGGAIENLGVMPLLARHVHNILVFNNTSEPCMERNSDLQALFLPSAASDFSSDTRDDQVFDPAKWKEVSDKIVAARETGQPQIYCGTDWSVRKNRRYNIRQYDGLNICFIYNASAWAWERLLPKGVLPLVKGNDLPIDPCRAGGASARYVKNFPYFALFELNKPHLIQLTVPQVNLLANLTAWTVSNKSTVSLITRTMKVLPCPSGMACEER